MFKIFICIVTALFVTYLLIPVVLALAARYDKKTNKMKKASPPFGGVAIFLGIICSLFLWTKTGLSQYISTILIALIIVFLLGIIDDLIRLSPFKKLIGQTIAVLFVIYYNDLRITSLQGIWLIHDLPIIVSYALTIFTIVVITNAYNLIDGIDGLAAIIGIIISSCFMLFFIYSNDSSFIFISAAVVGSLIAFLKYNYRPAIIYMGDTGSLLVGFLLSVFAIRMIESPATGCLSFLEGKSPVIAIAVLIIPLFDSLRVFIIRVLEKRPPLKGDFSHLHHTLMKLGFSNDKTILSLASINLFFILLVFFLSFLNINYLLLIIVGICSLISYILTKQTS